MENARNISKLIYDYSDGHTTTIGGVDMSNHFSTTLGAAGGDVKVTTFP